MYIVTSDTTLGDLADEFKKTAVFPPDRAKEYLRLGMISEVGEACNVWKKVIRDDNGILGNDKGHRIASELGDTLWYIIMGMAEYGLGQDQRDLTLHGFHEHGKQYPAKNPFDVLPLVVAEFDEFEQRSCALGTLSATISFFSSPVCTGTEGFDRRQFNLLNIAQEVLGRLSSRAAGPRSN